MDGGLLILVRRLSPAISLLACVGFWWIKQGSCFHGPHCGWENTFCDLQLGICEINFRERRKVKVFKIGATRRIEGVQKERV